MSSGISAHPSDRNGIGWSRMPRLAEMLARNRVKVHANVFHGSSRPIGIRGQYRAQDCRATRRTYSENHRRCDGAVKRFLASMLVSCRGIWRCNLIQSDLGGFTFYRSVARDADSDLQS